MNIIDIANLCGVSKSTVSRYLTGGSISQKTADKIAKAIEETGFEHNVAAVQLKTNKIGLVGAGLAERHAHPGGYERNVSRSRLSALLGIRRPPSAP